MSNSVFDGQPPMAPKNRTEQQILQRLRKELRKGIDITQGGVFLADLIRLELSDDMEIRRAAEELRRRAEKRFRSGPATKKQAQDAFDRAFGGDKQ